MRVIDLIVLRCDGHMVLVNDPRGFRSHLIFSSPEQKAQESFSDQSSLSVVCRLCCRWRRWLCRNFSHLHPLLQNHLINFNQTWHNASFGEGIQVCSNEGPCPFPRGDNYHIARIHWQN